MVWGWGSPSDDSWFSPVTAPGRPLPDRSRWQFSARWCRRRWEKVYERRPIFRRYSSAVIVPFSCCRDRRPGQCCQRGWVRHGKAASYAPVEDHLHRVFLHSRNTCSRGSEGVPAIHPNHRPATSPSGRPPLPVVPPSSNTPPTKPVNPWNQIRRTSAPLPLPENGNTASGATHP